MICILCSIFCQDEIVDQNFDSMEVLFLHGRVIDQNFSQILLLNKGPNVSNSLFIWTTQHPPPKKTLLSLNLNVQGSILGATYQ